MKYRGIVMVPTIIEFENPGSHVHVSNQARALCNNFSQVTVGKEVYEPKLLHIIPDDSPLYFDPPPQVA